MKKVFMVAAVVATTGVFAGKYEYQWDASDPQTSFGDGKVTLTLDGSSISAMQVNVTTNDTVCFSGDAMNFSAGATVTIPHGNLCISNAVTAAGDIEFIRTGTLEPWTGTNVGLFLDEYTLVQENVDLADIEVAYAHLSGSAGGGDYYNAEPYHVVRGDGWMEVQLQQSLSPNWTTKVIKIRLEQDGDDVKAKTLYAKYVMNTNVLGLNFDVPSSEYTIGTTTLPSSNNTPEYCYRCTGLKFAPAGARATVSISGTFNGAGKVKVDDIISVTFLNQDATIRSLELGNATLGVGTDETVADDAQTHEIGPLENGWYDFIQDSKLVELDLDSISGKLAGNMLTTTPTDAQVCYMTWVNNNTVLQFELQLKTSGSSYTKGVLVKLRDYNGNIQYCPASCWYYQGEPGTKSFAAGGCSQNNSYATTPTGSGYCVASLSARVFRWRRVIIEHGGSTTGGVIEVFGHSETCRSELRIALKTGLPTNGVVRVGQNGILSLIATNGFDYAKGVSNGKCEIYVGPGGKLRQGGNIDFVGNIGYDFQKITIDGGEAEFGCECIKPGSSADAVNTAGSTYLDSLTLKNGARCYGKAVRMGNIDSTWKITGTSPSVWDTGISILATYNAATLVRDIFDVDDVTESAAVDFTVTGDMKMFHSPSFPSDVYQKLRITKKGAGTMKVNGVTDFCVEPLEIQGGTWMVGSDDTMNSAQNILLAGGSFASADDVTASVGRLLVDSAGGGIDVGDASAVSFADSSSEDWSGRVDISCPAGSSVRFGTTSAGLTSAQLRKMRLNGQHVKLDENGYAVVRSVFAISFR
ncbi:MAG: hypothetical protein IKO72_14380 [Kiritimatiellae bacterium]|nr:hypothetical protein [Kiritimatiellia bacterium]